MDKSGREAAQLFLCAHQALRGDALGGPVDPDFLQTLSDRYTTIRELRTDRSPDWGSERSLSVFQHPALGTARVVLEWSEKDGARLQFMDLYFFIDPDSFGGKAEAVYDQLPRWLHPAREQVVQHPVGRVITGGNPIQGRDGSGHTCGFYELEVQPLTALRSKGYSVYPIHGRLSLHARSV